MAAKKISAHRCVPLCAFFCTFTIVMTILVLSTDMRPRRRHWRVLNNSSDDGADSRLANLIRAEHLRPPPADDPPRPSGPLPRPLPELAQLFGWKRNGVFVEAGAYGRDNRSDTEWLEAELRWRGLLLQSDPATFRVLLSRNRTRSHAANVCLSPDVTTKSSGDSGGVPCFPLNALLLAYNATRVDLLSLHSATAADAAHLIQALGGGRWGAHAVSVNSLGGGGTLLARLMRALAPLGYKLDRFASTNGRWMFVCARCRGTLR